MSRKCVVACTVALVRVYPQQNLTFRTELANELTAPTHNNLSGFAGTHGADGLQLRLLISPTISESVVDDDMRHKFFFKRCLENDNQ